MQDSKRFLSKFWNIDFPELGDDETDSKEQINVASYVNEQFDVQIFDSSHTSVDEILKPEGSIYTVLGRLCNALIYTLNCNAKLPKYILLVLDDDLIRCVNFSKPGVSEIYGRDLLWLANELHDAIFTRKGDLPRKAKKYYIPKFFGSSCLCTKI